MAGTASYRTSRGLAAKIALLAAASLLALLAAEAVSRWWAGSVPQLELDIYRRGPDGNLLLRPGVRRRHSTRYWDVTVSINAEGWRDRERPATAGAPVVVGLGDSFAFGWGVELEDSMFFLLEQALNRRHPLRLVKAGVPGTGSGDQLRLLQWLWPRYQPAAVVLVFFVGNDFVDVQMGGAAQFEVRDGLLIRRELSEVPAAWIDVWRNQAVRRSHLVQLLIGTWWQWTRRARGGIDPASKPPRRWDEWLREFAQIHLRDYPQRTERAVEQTLGFLTKIQRFCESRSSGFLLVVVPRSYQIYPRETEELKTALKLTDDELDLDKPQRILNEWSKRAGVACVDLLPAFRKHHRERPEQRLFYYPDAHLNRLGHRVAADAIQPLLLEVTKRKAP